MRYFLGSLIRNLYKDINKNDFNKAFIGNRKDAHKNILDMISINVIMKERTPLYGNLKLFKTIQKLCIIFTHNADKKQTKVYLIPEDETRDSHTYHYTAIKTRKFTLENKKMRLKIQSCKEFTNGLLKLNYRLTINYLLILFLSKKYHL